MQQTPSIPPRPSRSADKDLSSGATPRIPPRPINKRLERSVSPNAGRFAPSPLNEGFIAKSSNGIHLSPFNTHDGSSEDPIERSSSVNMPSVGEEGAEYSAVTEELQQEALSRSASPEQTRTVADDLHLHAPKPSLPVSSAKQRVMAVTRTDSDKAASFGIGRGSDERAPSREGAHSRDGIKKKRTSSVFSGTSDVGQHTDDEHGIPEIGQRVPMNPHLGDVQAPSPGPSEVTKKHHRKHSSRGLPPGSYGLHGHGVAPQDKLEKAYYEKHPELVEKEHHTPLHDRQNDFAMSSSDLNKLVRDTASRATGVGASTDKYGTPTDEVAFQASEEYASRMTSPRPPSTAPKAESSLKHTFQAEISDSDGNTIHVDDARHPEFRSYGDGGSDSDHDNEYKAPILASDQVVKGSSPYLQHPAVHPPPERRGSAFEMEDAPSLPNSRPASIHAASASREFGSTPLEDVEEYEPLFPEDEKHTKEKQESPDESKVRRYFPSKDVWEDAPNSVHFTTEVSTPDVSEPSRRKSSSNTQIRPITPAQAFALQQEELAEKHAKGLKTGGSFLPLSEEKPTWAGHQAHVKRPTAVQRFPSRDVWEDVPESQLQQTVISGEPKEEEEKEQETEAKPEIPSRPAKRDVPARPSIPERPRPKQSVADESKSKPIVSDKPKPTVPTRPARSSPGEGETPKAKPPVPSRPMGGKIAALQAGFMNDLNKRLQIGPQAVKKEEPSEQQEVAEEKEKAPLSDARKGRARGPQRRAPAKSPIPAAAPAAQEAKVSAPTLTFSMPSMTWAIDPDLGDVAVQGETKQAPEEAAKPISEPEPAEPAASEPVSVLVPESVPESVPEPVVEASPEAAEPPAKAEEPAPSTEATEEPEEKTLVANTAGESILETAVKKDEESEEVKPVAVSDEVKA
ncbi:altered inheritance of mitochondria protein 21 [Stachybotrys elegans]|uniref:Altered inheritance of mitochondria protein 21 n=1 Tax=Stachybotrys elegans TaxID=80388 RepID=A0A8K0SMC3_9HYPO|nr:altered inheritance of mitochondria protein 21 [Stachybotrys elegans]